MSIAVQVAHHLPYLRRVARALTGSQVAGDDQVARLLEGLVADPAPFPTDISPKLALYWALMRIRRGDAGARKRQNQRECHDGHSGSGQTQRARLWRR